MSTNLPRHLYYKVTATAFFLAAVHATGIADTKVAVDQLPQPLIKTDECRNVNLNGFGWDGTRSCFISKNRFYGAPLPLSMTTSDYTGGSLVWNESDISGKTVRCDNYRRQRFAENNEYIFAYGKSSWNITFLTEDTETIDPGPIDLTEVTAHFYSKDWYVGHFGRLNTGLAIDFSSDGISTETGYILINESTTRNNEKLVSNFSHCYFANEETPLRATDYCVDYDGDGIGWNGEKTCAVVPDPACDYSNADYSLGWGYVPATGKSCPPLPDE